MKIRNDIDGNPYVSTRVDGFDVELSVFEDDPSNRITVGVYSGEDTLALLTLRLDEALSLVRGLDTMVENALKTKRKGKPL